MVVRFLLGCSFLKECLVFFFLILEPFVGSSLKFFRGGGLLSAAGSPRLRLMGRLVWWWFENSRACLYYLLVNYCQFIACLADCRVPERWLNGGEVFVGMFFP